MVARGDLVKSFTKVKILLYGLAGLQVGDSKGCAHESEIVFQGNTCEVLS